MFQLTINTDNAAFDGDRGGEIARILEKLAVQMRNGYIDGNADIVVDGAVRDINGNTVGSWTLDPRDN